MEIRKLEKRGALQLLFYLSKNEGVSRSKLRNVKASVDAIYSTLDVLKDLKLIEEKKLEEFPFSIVVSLTEKGYRVAETIIELENRLAEVNG